MGISVEIISNRVRVNTLDTGAIFQYRNRVYMVTDGYLYGHYMDFVHRIIVCIEDGLIYRGSDFLGSEVGGSFAFVLPVSNAVIRIE